MNDLVTKAGAIDPDQVIEAIQPDRTQLVVISEIEQGLAEMESEFTSIPDVTQKGGMKTAKDRQKVLATALSTGEAARVAYTKPLFDEKKRIDTSWNKGIEPRLRAMKDPLDAAIREEQGRIAREEKERAMAEEARQDEIRLRIQNIESTPATLLEIEDCEAFISTCSDINFSEFMEFQDDARRTVEKALSLANERLNTLIEKRDEAARLETQRIEQAEEQGRIDAQKEEQRKEDEARAKEQADFEKEKAEFAAAKLAESEQKRAAEEQRVARHNATIKSIQGKPAMVTSVIGCDAAIEFLKSYEAKDYEEFGEQVVDAASDAVDSITLKRDEFETLEKLADEKAAQELEDARLLGIQQQKEREEKERKDAEARQAEAVAEAQRIAAMQPELERIRSWLEALHVAKLPVIESAELAEVTKVYDNAICKMDEMLTVLEMQKAA